MSALFLFMIALQYAFLTPWPRNYGVVTVIKDGLVCVTWKNDKECQHVLLILTLKDSDYTYSLEVICSRLDSIGASQSTKSSRLVGISESKITFEPDPEVQMIFKRGGIQNIQLSDKGEQYPIDAYNADVNGLYNTKSCTLSQRNHCIGSGYVIGFYICVLDPSLGACRTLATHH